MKKLTIKCTCFLVVAIMLVALLPSDCITIVTEAIDSQTNVGAFPIISAPITNINIPTRVSFDNTDVLEYTFETDGLQATEVSTGSMEFDVIATDEFGVLDVYATHSDGTVAKSSVYSYTNENNTYFSDISQDQAWYDCMKLKYDNGEITLGVFQSLLSELSRGYASEYTPDIDDKELIPGKTRIRGVLKWDESTTEMVPLISAKVQLVKKVGGTEVIIDYDYTDESGEFEFAIDNEDWSSTGEDIFIRWWLEAKTFKVTYNWVIHHYCFESSIRENVDAGTTETFYYYIPIDPNINHYKATYVHQVMVITERFAIEMGMSVPEYGSSAETKTKLSVAYPAWFAPSYSGYCFGDDFLSIASIGRDQFADIDMITHEYGHYVQYLEDIYGATIEEIICNWPEHEPLADNFTDKASKEYAMELTWSEAWASMFSTLAEHYYWFDGDNDGVKEYQYFDSVSPYGDQYMPYKGCRGWNAESPNNSAYDHDNDKTTPPQDNRGEAQEMAVEAFLWDLYDTSTSESFDDVALGYQNWWNCTTQAGIYTLEDFISYMDSVHPELRSEIGAIMAYHKISPDTPVPSAYSACEPPELTFVINGGEAHPNNRFVVYFYDATGNCLGETDMFNQHGQYLDEENIDDSFVGHRETVTVQIDNDIWQSVLQEIEGNCATGATVYVSIGGYRYDDTSPLISDDIREYSGPYFSPYITLDTFNLSHNYYLEDIGDGYHAQECFNCGHVDEDTIEEHSFDGWVFVSDTLHRSECECGARGSTTAGHVFIMPDSPSDPRICMGCGYTKFLGGNGGNIIISISKVTVNGSYQMPDGTVYLVDADIEAYLNGTLVFYDKDDLPVVQ